ncbi:MAG TPA: DUF2130 domain-containing protein [bacterium]|nr:DUF2130 domain-containing protein [bacterium]HMY35448.1 DUF2130 domain-containing protein [bacterium]HNC49017.1 DUF2130 domain-containing protein [bacterium]HNH29842.1 DUF2130 domain-containing protein [bacterium]
MSEQIICPKCKHQFELSDAFQSRFEAQAEQKIRDEFNQKFKSEIAKREEKIRRDTMEQWTLQLADLQQQLAIKDKNMQDARTRELQLMKQQREIEEREQNLKLETERLIMEERNKIRLEVEAKAIEAFRLKDAEKDKRIADMMRQVDELKRKAEQGSQQSQGEVMELALENLLREKFPLDVISEVPKGIRGADVLQRVYNRSGLESGTIIWESKRTKEWSPSWIQKLKDDMRSAGANVAVLVTQALPKEIKTMGNLDGVWITGFGTAVELAEVLRVGMTELAQTRIAAVGKNEKMEMLYNYLTGNEFRQKMEAVLEAFVQMRGDLDQERRSMEKNWQRREKQIERMMVSMSRMNGDLEGIMGTALPAIPALELPGDKS